MDISSRIFKISIWTKLARRTFQMQMSSILLLWAPTVCSLSVFFPLSTIPSSLTSGLVLSVCPTTIYIDRLCFSALGFDPKVFFNMKSLRSSSLLCYPFTGTLRSLPQRVCESLPFKKHIPDCICKSRVRLQSEQRKIPGLE